MIQLQEELVQLKDKVVVSTYILVHYIMWPFLLSILTLYCLKCFPL